MKRLPIGISDFKKLIDEDCYYVDKTLFIKELIDSSGDVILIPRPRRFGKTLNLSMLKYFFEKTETDTSNLFVKTAIWQHEECRKFQGKYPVISITFKDIKEDNWDVAYKKMVAVIAEEFEHHVRVLEPIMNERQLVEYKRVMEKLADQVTYHNSLFFLSKLLHEAYNEKVIVLIDEYDSPIHAGYAHEYYDKVVGFMRSLLSAVLKDNSYLQRGIITGILRTAKEGIFSGLNNLKVCSLLSTEFQDKFGFTQSEVEQLLQDYALLGHLPEVQQWYNGYTFAATTIYNPWSLLMFGDTQGRLQPYWINTSDNKIIKKLFATSGKAVKTELEELLSDKIITKIVDEAVIFPGIEANAQAVWSLLLFSGYVTCASYTLERGKIHCNLKIPNEEVKVLYESFIQEIVEEVLKDSTIGEFFGALLTGDVEIFEALLQEFMLNSVSMYDLPADEPEKSYHLFVLGLLVLLQDTYQVKSNRESGFGRYDIMLIPHDKNKLGIVMEFKKAGKDSLEVAVQRALDQIKEKKYAQELHGMGIKEIKAFGIAFQGKDLLVRMEDGA